MRVNSKAGAWFVAQPGAARTLMPFLYQTRTLSRFRHLQSTRQLYSTPGYSQSQLSDSKIISESKNLPIRKVVTSSNTHPRSRTHRPADSHSRDVKRFEGRRGGGIPWESDFGQPETNERNWPLAAEPRGTPSNKSENFDDMIFSADEDPFADEDLSNANAGELDTSAEATTRPVRESTITVNEKYTFERIFADIIARSKSAGAGATPGLAPSKNQSTAPRKKSVRGREPKVSFKSPMNEVPKTQEELRADVDKYPFVLRAAAARALGLTSARSKEPLQDEIISNVDDLEIIRRPERERVESLLRDAKTDVELWQVMEAEVFALVTKLGIEEKPEVQAGETKTRVRKNKKKDLKVANDDVTESTGHKQPLDLNVYGPLYPSHVLLALRLLDRSFAKPSPLVLNVLPRIKSLGIVSYVLGASTALYNDLLRILWSRYDDFLGVSKLLKEMDQAGLEFDNETLNIVNEIHQAQLKVRRGDRGTVLQALWSMPEFAPGKFRFWKEKIQTSIEERGTDISDDVTWEP